MMSSPLATRDLDVAALADLLGRARVLPVVTIARAEDAVPLARALLAGGLAAIEVTLRTDAALEAVRRIAAEVPAMLVGAGTLTRPREVEAAARAGARFGVSPGATPALLAAARDAGLPFLPGVMTPSEALAARDQGFSLLKLFPARAAGGLDLLRSLAGPLPDLRFCPTGGIDAASLRDYLALANVVCVGGSWMAPPALVAAGDFARVTELAREVSA